MPASRKACVLPLRPEEGPPPSSPAAAEVKLERADDPVQRIRQRGERRVAVEQVRDAAQQVPEQVARTRLRGHVEHDLVEMDRDAQQVQVERSEFEMQDRARACRLK